ncbi:transposase [Shewanella algae]|uniref:IS110 family transposase n=1 Tax=Shewanella algae TaxID=38313 RepID=UPI001182DF19|nr:IS110 family transposase [Shewanella algae]TVL60754.1 transposase [Shewanella algae]
MKATVTLGIDLAKNSFSPHGISADGTVTIKKSVTRVNLAKFIAKLEPCLIGMEACAGAHYWARKFTHFGHEVKLMPPQYVKPYVKTNKNDAADAEAICEAVTRPNMRFVPAKSVDQQAILSVHRARELLVQSKTAQTNQIRGLLAEFGVVIARGRGPFKEQLPDIIEDASNELPCVIRETLQCLLELVEKLSKKITALERTIQAWSRQSADASRLEQVPGIGPITASALVATVGNAKHFKNARQLAAWLGLVPRQHSTGGKTVLLGISKRGDGYVRKLLVHGARAVVSHSKRAKSGSSEWLNSLLETKHTNTAIVALANKNARIAWALLTNQSEYVPQSN